MNKLWSGSQRKHRPDPAKFSTPAPPQGLSVHRVARGPSQTASVSGNPGRKLGLLLLQMEAEETNTATAALLLSEGVAVK